VRQQQCRGRLYRLIPEEHAADGRRSLQQLKNSSDILSGIEEQTLRTFCTSEYLDVITGLSDVYGTFLKDADLPGLQRHFEQASSNPSTASASPSDELFAARWGPTRIPVYNVILTLMYMNPSSRLQRLQMIDWLIDKARVSVDGTDLSGTSALMHSISTKPYMDVEFAQRMFDAGANINLRNRYGCTAAHDLVMVRPMEPAKERKVAEVLTWFVGHGGDLDIKEGNGMSARYILGRVKRIAPSLEQAVLVGEAQAKEQGKAHTTMKKVGQNEPCPCGEVPGRKYKKCCGKKA